MTTIGPRYPTLDILRGVAVMGILTMNIQAFALPEAAYFAPIGPHSQGPVNQASWLFDFVLFNNKMRGLFSLLFGASCLLIIERAVASGQSPAKVHYRRMGWLLIFGLFHLLFIWWGDILVNYAIAGCVLYLARNVSAGGLWRWAIALFALDFMIFGVPSIMGALMYIGWLPADSMSDLMANMDGGFAYDSDSYAEEITLMQSSYGAIVADRFANLADAIIFILIIIPGTIGLMMMGMALYRNGFLTGQYTINQYRRIAFWTLGFALPANVIMGIWYLGEGQVPFIGFAINLGFGATIQLFATVGLAAIIMWWWKAGGCNSHLAAMLSRTGQMAFSNYLGTSIVMTWIFYGYGLGLYGQVQRIWLWAFVLCAWAVMMALSSYWLARYYYGPMEWLWRSLARVKLQPMRRNQGASG